MQCIFPVCLKKNDFWVFRPTVAKWGTLLDNVGHNFHDFTDLSVYSNYSVLNGKTSNTICLLFSCHLLLHTFESLLLGVHTFRIVMYSWRVKHFILLWNVPLFFQGYFFVLKYTLHYIHSSFLIIRVGIIRVGILFPPFTFIFCSHIYHFCWMMLNEEYQKFI